MDWLITGRIRGAFGLTGCIKIESCSGEYEHFFDLEEIRLKFPRQQAEASADTLYRIEKCEVRSSDMLLKLKGIDSPEAAKKLCGADILVPRDRACPLDEGEFYITDLCNAVLVYEGTIAGTITDVVEGGGCSLLEVSEAATGNLCYIPFRSEFVGNIDIKKKQVELMHRWILE